ncbi:PREDICTED: nascent polypeptide-associated complex subunit alpha, muscle-specific form-like [Vollenhovia emeryi]|uniref:nascent polypeptide-associated complex subunit alpha, muscle-specific form-like n=1 Tax=Vollenhovia emeryi TaxID=411798 RepID=UPI0005F4B8CD|nr:PREDICTED: nascent polypeptide-associated complex subunit alpha, muscle-specific form-like [Vollenhovia emeryi]
MEGPRVIVLAYPLPNRVQCPRCYKGGDEYEHTRGEFCDPAHLVKHLNKMHPGDTIVYECSVCEYRGKTRYPKKDVAIHYDRRHSVPRTEPAQTSGTRTPPVQSPARGRSATDGTGARAGRTRALRQLTLAGALSTSRGRASRPPGRPTASPTSPPPPPITTRAGSPSFAAVTAASRISPLTAGARGTVATGSTALPSSSSRPSAAAGAAAARTRTPPGQVPASNGPLTRSTRAPLRPTPSPPAYTEETAERNRRILSLRRKLPAAPPPPAASGTGAGATRRATRASTSMPREIPSRPVRNTPPPPSTQATGGPSTSRGGENRRMTRSTSVPAVKTGTRQRTTPPRLSPIGEAPPSRRVTTRSQAKRPGGPPERTPPQPKVVTTTVCRNPIISTGLPTPPGGMFPPPAEDIIKSSIHRRALTRRSGDQEESIHLDNNAGEGHRAAARGHQRGAPLIGQRGRGHGRPVKDSAPGEKGEAAARRLLSGGSPGSETPVAATVARASPPPPPLTPANYSELPRTPSAEGQPSPTLRPAVVRSRISLPRTEETGGDSVGADVISSVAHPSAPVNVRGVMGHPRSRGTRVQASGENEAPARPVYQRGQYFIMYLRASVGSCAALVVVPTSRGGPIVPRQYTI